MPSYTYTAKDVTGNIRKGTLSAEDEQDFLAKIHEKGLFPTEYNEAAGIKQSTHKFSTKELAFNCRQMAAMLTSGLTLVKALDILCREQEKDESFSASLEMHSGSFPQFLISMVAAGESSGSLDQIMQRMSDHYAKENKMHNTIKSAMMYPIILVILCVAVVIGLFTFIMPTFAGLFTNEEDMPALTRVMMSISNFLRGYWYILIGFVLIAVFGIRYAMKMPNVRLKWDRFIIKGPGFGALVVKIYTARFARTLSSLYSSGIPMVECLERSSAILNNSYIDEKFRTVVDEVKQGETLSASIQRTEIFESMFCSIIYVGEEAGALDDILAKTSDYYDEEADSAVQRLVGMLEPVMIIVLGIMVGLIVASVLPALYDSFENIE